MVSPSPVPCRSGFWPLLVSSPALFWGAACLSCSGCGQPGEGAFGDPVGFTVARLTNTPVLPQSQESLAREVRAAILAELK